MAYYVNLLLMVIYSVICSVLFGIAVCIMALQMPLYLFRKVFRKPSYEQSIVRLFVHEPTNDSSYGADRSPRDTILLIHGFPDSQSLWDEQVKALNKEGYRCLVAATPGSNGEAVPRALEPEEVVTLLKEALIDVCDEPVTVIGHDWGSVFALLFRDTYPSQCKRMILLDVGFIGLKSDIPLFCWVFMFSYQSLLAFCYVLGRPVGTWIMRAVMFMFMYKERPLSQLKCDMAFPYLSLPRMFLTKGSREGQAEGRTAARRIPHLFLYGRNKEPIRFHDSDWEKFVRSTPHGKVASVPAGHFLMTEDAEATNFFVTEWLQDTEGLHHVPNR